MAVEATGKIPGLRNIVTSAPNRQEGLESGLAAGLLGPVDSGAEVGKLVAQELGRWVIFPMPREGFRALWCWPACLHK